jgi:hypothetical protein
MFGPGHLPYAPGDIVSNQAKPVQGHGEIGPNQAKQLHGHGGLQSEIVLDALGVEYTAQEKDEYDSQ